MRGQSRWLAAAFVLLLSGAGFLGAGLNGHQDPLTTTTTVTPGLGSPSSAAQPTPTRTTKPPAIRSATSSAARSTGQSGLARSTPVSLRIPAIGVAISLSSLGLNPNGTVQVPTEYQQPGWFRLGPAPGQMGSAVILGHVDDKSGPAAFYRLKSLRSGDTVDVSLANGLVAHFVVKTVATYLKTQFPSQRVYASHGFPALQLVTCGGQFNSSTGHYLSNVVAYTSLVSTTPAGRK
jgi:hypothetical protein